MSNTIGMYVLVIPALLIGVIFHEYMHGKAAELFGDPTARNAGRLTLNPVASIDPFGSVLLPLILLATAWLSGAQPLIFGYAKPVPINPMYFKHGRRDMFWVGLAGPATNLAIAVLAALLFRGIYAFGVSSIILVYILQFFIALVEVNVVLAVFNLIPIPPLDGSRLIEAFLPPRYLKTWRSFEQFGFIVLVLLLFVFGSYFWAVIEPIINTLFKILMPGSM